MARWDLLFVAGTFASLFLPIFFAFIAPGKQLKEAQERARARGIAENKLNARFLRLDI